MSLKPGALLHYRLSMTMSISFKEKGQEYSEGIHPDCQKTESTFLMREECPFTFGALERDTIREAIWLGVTLGVCCASFLSLPNFLNSL